LLVEFYIHVIQHRVAIRKQARNSRCLGHFKHHVYASSANIMATLLCLLSLQILGHTCETRIWWKFSL